MKNKIRHKSCIKLQATAIVHSVRKTLGAAIQKSGKVFYSPQTTLFDAKYILMGYNPGGDPKYFRTETIEADLDKWQLKEGNDYWSENWGRDKPSRLQTSVRCLFKSLDIDKSDIFTSNLNFVRSRSIQELKKEPKVVDACAGIWRKFLSKCPARRILCIGVETGADFKELLGATESRSDSIPTRHGRVKAYLLTLAIGDNEYLMAVLPHLSRFAVQDDPKLISAIRKHFRMR